MNKTWLRGIGRGLIAALTLSLPVLAAGHGANWTVGGGNLHNTRHAATETEIGPENVADLVPQWVFAAHGDISATPTFEGNALYVVDWGGYLHKIDRKSGRAIWSRSVGEYSGNPASVSRTSPAIDGNRLYLGLQDGGRVLAVNKQTGNLLWSTQIEDHFTTYITQSPVVFGGTVYVGTATDGERIYVALANFDRQPYTLAPAGAAADSGSWAALDATTGEILWQTADPTGSFPTGAATVANGVVYAGTMDAAGHMYGLSAASGDILWQYAAGGSVNAGPAVVGGTVYWGSGYSRYGLGTGSNKLYAFALPR